MSGEKQDDFEAPQSDEVPGNIPPIPTPDPAFQLVPLHHTYLTQLVDELDQNGLEGLFGIGEVVEGVETAGTFAHQLAHDRGPWDAVAVENCTLLSLDPTISEAQAPTDAFAFVHTAPQRIYNWELFVHAPLRIAERLKEQGLYAAALRWLRLVFDPSLAVQPFATAPSATPTIDDAWRPRPLWDPVSFTDLAAKYARWTENPFDVHGVAENDPQVYRFAVARLYTETLIAWGDELFSRDTMESIAEATQVYLMALEFLGPRPVGVVVKTSRGTGLTFAALRSKGETADGLRNPLTEIENLLTHERAGEPTIRLDTSSIDPSDTTGYFCEPRNDRHLQLWDTLDDRLFKIRHCMNIDGVVRLLPIFEPPIDPRALVAGAAAGRSASEFQPTRWVSPHVRFAAMVSLAKSLAQSVQRLGGALQQALQSRDAEALAALRQRQEVDLLGLAADVRRMQVDEARLARAAILETRAITQVRLDHYTDLIAKGQLPAEDREEELMQKSQYGALSASVSTGIGALFAKIPDTNLQGIASGTTWGGRNLAEWNGMLGASASLLATHHSQRGSNFARKAQRVRRRQEWKLQRKLALAELGQIDAQLDGADQRIQIAERELANHGKQRAFAQEVDRLLRSRFTNEELFAWTIGQVSQLHAQTFQLALEVARKAEVCFRRELGLQSSSYIGAGHWNASRKGLVAGDKLTAELERMEVAFVEQDRRELEITKHVSLQRSDPEALLELKAKGVCTFALPEVLFDMDFPGHYLRRIKGVTVSIPCVAGPYEGLNATLALSRSEVRTDPSPTTTAAYTAAPRVPERWTERVALSAGQQDGGLFTFDFRDAKYLPFEHRGVISDWTLELAGSEVTVPPTPLRPQFDWDSISDVVLHVRYTARHEAGLKEPARGAVTAALEALRGAALPLQLGLSFRHDAPDAWAAFLEQDTGTAPIIALSLDRSRLPYLIDPLQPKVRAIRVVLWCADGVAGSAGSVHVGINATAAAADPALPSSPGIGGQPTYEFPYPATFPGFGAGQQLAVKLTGLTGVVAGGLVDPTLLLDVVVLLDLDFTP